MPAARVLGARGLGDPAEARGELLHDPIVHLKERAAAGAADEAARTLADLFRLDRPDA